MTTSVSQRLKILCTKFEIWTWRSLRQHCSLNYIRGCHLIYSHVITSFHQVKGCWAHKTR